MGVGRGDTLPCKKRKLRSLQEIQLDFEEEAKAYARLWSQGKKERRQII
jgi:hypothetical protein